MLHVGELHPDVYRLDSGQYYRRPLRVGISNGFTGSTALSLKSIGYCTSCSILCPSSVAGMNSMVFTAAIAASAKSLYVARVQTMDSGLARPEVSTTN